MTVKVPKIVLRKIDYWDMWVFLTAFILVIPDGIGHISPLLEGLVYNWGLYVIFAGILFMFVLKKYQIRSFSNIFIIFLSFIGASILILFFKGHGLSAWINCFSSCLFVVLFAEANRDRLDRIILSFLIVLELWIYINFALMIFIPKGMYYLETQNYNLNWVLGYKSSLQYYIFPALCFSWLNEKYRNQRVRFFSLLTVSWATTLITKNSMLIIGLLVFTAFQISPIWNKEKLFNIWTFYAIDIVVNIVLVFYITWFSKTVFGVKLFAMLGKTAALSRRSSIIWPMTLDYIKEHWLFGNGIYTSQIRELLYRGIPGFIHSHNQLMEITFIGGVFMLVLYLYMHFFIGKSLKENNTYAAKILSMSIFVLYLMMVVEVFTRRIAAPIWLMLFLGGNCRLVHNAFMQRKDCKLSES